MKFNYAIMLEYFNWQCDLFNFRLFEIEISGLVFWEILLDFAWFLWKGFFLRLQ
jgi:hypothetical protein